MKKRRQNIFFPGLLLPSTRISLLQLAVLPVQYYRFPPGLGRQTNHQGHDLAQALQHRIQYSTVYCTTQCTVQHSVLYNTVYSTAQFSRVQNSTVCCTAQYRTVQHSTVQHSTVQHTTVNYSRGRNWWEIWEPVSWEVSLLHMISLWYQKRPNIEWKKLTTDCDRVSCH